MYTRYVINIRIYMHYWYIQILDYFYYLSLDDTETDVHNSLGGTGVGVGVGITHCPSSFTAKVTNNKYKRYVS